MQDHRTAKVELACRDPALAKKLATEWGSNLLHTSRVTYEEEYGARELADIRDVVLAHHLLSGTGKKTLKQNQYTTVEIVQDSLELAVVLGKIQNHELRERESTLKHILDRPFCTFIAIKC